MWEIFVLITMHASYSVSLAVVWSFSLFGCFIARPKPSDVKWKWSMSVNMSVNLFLYVYYSRPDKMTPLSFICFLILICVSWAELAVALLEHISFL